jgi:hypothetical protein
MMFDIDQETKAINILFETLELTKFEIIEDNNTGIKDIEGEIRDGLV